jgi:hypothetical protein
VDMLKLQSSKCPNKIPHAKLRASGMHKKEQYAFVLPTIDSPKLN